MTKKIFETKQSKVSSADSTMQQRMEAGQPVEFAENGLFHTAIPIETIAYKSSANEQVMKNAGSYIVLGTDKPGGDASGYGAIGSNRANSIDLVVGRMSNSRGGKGPPGEKVEKHR